MDGNVFDGIAIAFSGASTRRDGVRALLAVALGAGSSGSAAAAPARRRMRHPNAEGPCKTTKRPDNVCTRDSECCTNICNTKTGDRNKDRKGRCRCIRRGGPCTATRNCCSRGGQQMTCNNGICGDADPGPGPGPSPIPTGQSCVDGVDTCLDAAASCTTYFQTTTPGTFCLLPNGASCAASGDCRSDDCSGGVCAAESCDVCATGCPYSTVQAALNAPPATGAVIRIDDGTYTEDLIAPAVSFTLTNCNGSTPVLKNASDDTRTLVLGSSSDSTPYETITISNITITGKGTPVAGDSYPITPPAAGDGGIDAYTNLILDGTAKVTGCNWNGRPGGGGIAMLPKSEIVTLTVRGTAEVSDNYSQFDGGGIIGDSYSNAPIILEGNALVTRNFAGNEGGGIYTGYENIVRISGSATVSHNRSVSEGGGVSCYGYTNGQPVFIMRENASVVFNSSLDGSPGMGDGGGLYVGAGQDTTLFSAEFHDNALVADNQSANQGGGLAVDVTANVLLTNSARITRNDAAKGGGGVYGADLDIRESAQVISNTPEDCDTYTLSAGSKSCGV